MASINEANGSRQESAHPRNTQDDSSRVPQVCTCKSAGICEVCATSNRAEEADTPIVFLDGTGGNIRLVIVDGDTRIVLRPEQARAHAMQLVDFAMALEEVCGRIGGPR